VCRLCATAALAARLDVKVLYLLDGPRDHPPTNGDCGGAAAVAAPAGHQPYATSSGGPQRRGDEAVAP
jgi:hypothetical protein